MTDSKQVKLNAAVEAATAKLKAAQEALDKYVADASAREAALNIPEGTEGSFTFGRADTAKTLSGKVIAVVPTGNGNLLKVLAGEGKDLKVYDVASSKFTPNVAALEGTADPIVGGNQSLAAAINAADELGVALEPDLSNHPKEVVTGTELTQADAAVQSLL
jgi:hypothetical protein